MTPEEAFAELERVAARDVGRGGATLAAYTRGGLGRAARSLVVADPLDVVVLTGFLIPAASPPAAETDGPLGAAQLAAAVRLLGGRVRLLTDEPCAPVVRAALRAAGVDAEVDAAPLDGFDDWAGPAAQRYAHASHLVAVKRVGPGADGVPRTVRGVDVSGHTAALDRLYAPGPAFRIGIGDGGNELGMGSLPPEVVADVVDRGELIRCVVGCEALLVGGTSNWAAAALVAALAVLGPDTPGLVDLLGPEWSHAVLRAMVDEAGAVDGVRRAVGYSVDGLDWADYRRPLAEMARVAVGGW
jgi:hypothetical protein